MENASLIYLAVLVPVIGSFLLPLLGKISETFRNVSALVMISVSLVCSFILVPAMIQGKPVAVASQMLGLNLFYADGLAVFMAIVSSLIGAVIVFYSFGYISHYEHRDEYYLMVILFLGAMMGIIFSRNLIILYLFWEITGITSWRLIGFFREKKHIINADKSFLVTVFGALLMLVGFLAVYGDTGTFDLGVINKAHISNVAVVLILFGILSKSATLPLHTWLPDAGVAPSPVTALLHAAVLVKIGVYVYARLFLASMSIDEVWQTVVPIIAAASALISAGAALIDTDMKRIIAFSTISQIGFIFLGLAVNNQVAIAGALLYILMHGLAKGGLFLCAGIVEQNTKTKDITQMGGLFKTMPVTAVAFLFCAFSVMGIPPFGGFFSKYLVISGAVQGHLYITIIFILGAFLTIIYLFRLISMIFLGEIKTPAREGSLSMLVSVVILAVLSLAAGIFINLPSQFVQSTVHQMLGMGQ